MQGVSISFIFDLVISVKSFPLSQIVFNTNPVVYCKGIFLNKDFTVEEDHMISSRYFYCLNTIRVGFTGSKFTMCSQIKEKAIFGHNSWLFYLGICPENNCSDNYLNDSAGRISERIIDHSGRDQNSHLFRNSWIKNHPNTSKTNFKINNSQFRNSHCRLALLALLVLLIKQIKPFLNLQEKSYKLKLFN